MFKSYDFVFERSLLCLHLVDQKYSKNINITIKRKLIDRKLELLEKKIRHTISLPDKVCISVANIRKVRITIMYVNMT